MPTRTPVTGNVMASLSTIRDHPHSTSAKQSFERVSNPCLRASRISKVKRPIL
jgi:hypothetical protein